MAKRNQKASKFPQTIYVNREQDSNDADASYLIANEDACVVDDGEAVAVYELREVKTKRVTHDLE